MLHGATVPETTAVVKPSGSGAPTETQRSARADGGPGHEPLSIVHVSQAVHYGLQRYLGELVADQRGRGWTVAVVSPPDADLEASCRDVGASHVRWDARRAPSAVVVPELLALRSILAAEPAEVVHLHSSKAGLVGRLALRGRRATLFSPHAWSFLHEGPATRWAARRWERFAARWTDVTLCCSDAERQRGEQAGIPGPMATVPNGVDLDYFAVPRRGDRARARRALGVPPGPLVLCVGRLSVQKGQDVLVRAWPEVLEAVPNAVLALVGGGELAAPVAPALRPSLVLAGHCDDVRPWLAAADLVVQPSRWEGMSLSVLEALASGRPVVATDVDGMREAIGGDASISAGAVVGLGDSSALVGAIVDRLQTPPLLEREQRRARDRASRFSLTRWANAIAELTTEVAARRRPLARRPR